MAQYNQYETLLRDVFEHGVHKSQVCRRNERIPETSEIIWEKMLEIMDDHIARGHLKAD